MKETTGMEKRLQTINAKIQSVIRREWCFINIELNTLLSIYFSRFTVSIHFEEELFIKYSLSKHQENNMELLVF